MSSEHLYSELQATPSVTSRRTIIGLPPPRKKVSTSRQFIGKNQLRPAAARAGTIFTGKLSAGVDFSGGDLIIEGLYGAGDILIRGRYINSVIISPWQIFHGRDILM